MTQPVADQTFALVVNGGATLTPTFRTPAPVAFAASGAPANDDPRFPYAPRLRNAGGFQFDVLSVRPLPNDYADGILDELGAPLRDTYGAAILPETT